MKNLNIDLPHEWKELLLKDVVEVIRNGLSVKQKKDGKGFPVSRIETIAYEEIDLERVGFVENLSKELVIKYSLQKGDILFSNINSDPHLGKTAIFNKDSLLLHGMNLLLIRTNKEIILPDYLNYLFNFYRNTGYFISIAHKSVNQSSINQANLKNTPIILAPIKEQMSIIKKINQYISQINSGIVSLKKAQNLLAHYKYSILRAATKGDLTKNWRMQYIKKIKPASVLLNRILEEKMKDVESEKLVDKKYSNLINENENNKKEFPNLPESWVLTNIFQISDSMKNGIYKPKEFYRDDGIACLRMYNIFDGEIIWKDIKRMRITEKEFHDYKLESGDILVNRVNSRELVGKSAVIPNNLENCIYESKNIRLRLHSSINSSYINYWFLVYSREYFNRNVQQTVGMASINQKQLGSMAVPLPSLREQEEIVKEVKTHLSIIKQTNIYLFNELLRTNKLKQSILKKAFEGKLIPFAKEATSLNDQKVL